MLSKRDVVGPLMMLVIFGSFAWWFVSSVNADIRNQGLGAQRQCQLLMDRARTYEDTTETLKYKTGRNTCLYWSTWTPRN
jgi:hypothetical protein